MEVVNDEKRGACVRLSVHKTHRVCCCCRLAHDGVDKARFDRFFHLKNRLAMNGEWNENQHVIDGGGSHCRIPGYVTMAKRHNGEEKLEPSYWRIFFVRGVILAKISQYCREGDGDGGASFCQKY